MKDDQKFWLIMTAIGGFCFCWGILCLTLDDYCSQNLPNTKNSAKVN